MIPKKLGHIWIGPKLPPVKWMQTWRAKHPDWEYTLYDNDYLRKTTFRTRRQIEEYFKREAYAGVSDLMRYEILYQHGGFLAEADSICYHNIEELLSRPCAYTVYENELVRGRLVSPVLACEPRNPFVGELINRLEKLNPKDLDSPWMSVGNLFVMRMIEELKPDITIFPSHTFIPVHYTGVFYQGKEKVYAKQLFGSTRGVYGEGEAVKKEEHSSFTECFKKAIDKRIKKFTEKKQRQEKRAKESYKRGAFQAEEQRIQKLFEKDDFSV